MDVPGAPVRVAVLGGSDRTAEERAALAWAREVADAAVAVDLGSLRAGDLDGFDVAWWHTDRAVEVAPVETAAPVVESFLTAGGGLLLSNRALAAVEPFDIDPVAPDEVGVYGASDPVGLYVKSLYRDHPAFEGFDTTDCRRPTCGPGERPYAVYDSMLPAEGRVLASVLHGGEADVGRHSMLAWDHGDGRVLGLGVGLSFADRHDGAFAREHDLFARNLLSVLGGYRRPSFTDRPDDAAGRSRLRRRLDDDHHRPQYHLTAPANWLNDPNGLLYHDGTYHVFYQYNPGAPIHGTIHWGHATSEDLVRWEDRSVALSPSPGGPDRDGCWSGCAVDDDGEVRLLYTGGRGRRQLPCLATALDDTLDTWEKHPGNPVIDEAPDAVLASEDWDAEFRDHCVWREDGWWYQIIGSGLADGEGGVALLYRSSNLREWEYVGKLLVGDWEGAGHMWECPELLDLGEKQLLHVSNYDEVQYYLGETDLETPGFDRDSSGLLDHGEFYAPQSLVAPDGRRLTWGWLTEARPVEAQWEAGWSGALSLPRELSLSGGRLRQRPARELRGLRERRVAALDDGLAAGERRPLPVSGRAYELSAEVDVEACATFVLSVLASPAGLERTTVRYDGAELVVDRSASSLDDRADAGSQRMPVAEGPLSLRAFVDGSVLELFANEHRCLTSRLYPTRPDADGAAVGAEDGAVDVDLTAWTLGSAYDSGPGSGSGSDSRGSRPDP